MFEPKRFTPRELLNAYDKLIVPSYQRPYSWTSKEVDDFWNDLFAIAVMDSKKEDFHFLGVIVSLPKGEKNLEIVDGQQRLLTIMLFLIALYDVLKENKKNITFSPEIDKIYNHLNHIVNLNFPFEIANTTVRRGIQKYTKTVGASHNGSQDVTKIDDAYKRIIFKIKERVKNVGVENSIISLYKGILDKMEILAVVTKEDYEAYTLFETLNSRGIALEPADLIKNKIMSLIKEEDMKKEISELWDRKIVSQMETGKRTSYTREFLRHYTLTIKKEPVSERQLYKLISSELTPIRYQAFLDDLFKFSDIYPDIIGLSVFPENDKTKLLLQLLRLFKIKAHNTLLMVLISKKEILGLDKINEILDIVLKFSLRWTLSKNNSQDLENFYQGLAYKFRYAEDLDISEIRADFLERSETNATLANAILGNPSKHSIGVMKVSLFLIEFSSGKPSPSIETLDLEHIAPVKPGAENNSWYRQLSEATYDSLVTQIGNYSLLENNLNRAASNLSWYDKALSPDAPYRKSNINIMRDIINFPDWNEETISLRNKWLGYAISEATSIEEKTDSLIAFAEWHTLNNGASLLEAERLHTAGSIKGESWIETIILCLPSDGSALHVDSIAANIKKYELRDLSRSRTPEATIRRDARIHCEKNSEGWITKSGDNAYSLTEKGRVRQQRLCIDRANL
jgi:uncharacterized protein with ParB-like and HNH nuclease domain